MVEAAMYAAIGFLIATLIGLAVIPLIHNRAVRLTMRDLEGGLPMSMGELQAEKDALRAEFALAVRRLEITNEQLRSKVANLMVCVSQKDDVINRLRSHLRADHDALTITPYERPARKPRARHQKAA